MGVISFFLEQIWSVSMYYSGSDIVSQKRIWEMVCSIWSI